MSAVAVPAPSQTVLVADDDPDLLFLIKIRLSKAGYNVVVASDGREALEGITRLRPDMVILDVMMPGMTGTDVLEQLRRAPATCDMPVIMMSASFLGTAGDAGVPPRADDYMAKPFSSGEPQSRVKALFKRRSTRETPPALSPADADADADAAVAVGETHDMRLTECAARESTPQSAD